MCRMTRRRVLGLVPALAAFAACGCGNAAGPAPVRWGHENCDYCGMIIDDQRYAGQLRAPGGKGYKFDDIGCAMMFLAKQAWAEDAGAEIWVGDSESGTWLAGRAAWYAGGRKTPMAYGFGAVAARRDGAVDFAAFRAAISAKGSQSRCDPAAQGNG